MSCEAKHKEVVHIVAGSDSNYAPHLAVMLCSLASTNSDLDFKAHIVHDGIYQNYREQVESSVQSMKFEWHDMSNHRVLNFSSLLHISRATYLRLAILDILPNDVHRVLYLDVDVIVLGSIRELWEMNLDNCTCAAVPDPGVDPDEFATKWNLPASKWYFNAGVMLIDLDRLRTNNSLQTAIDVLEKKSNICEFADQDALNIALWNQWKSLSPVWNFQRKFLYDNFVKWKELQPVLTKPVIIHFTEEYKPWRNSEWHPWSWMYLCFLSKTPFKNVVLKNGNISVLDRIKWLLRWHIKRPKILR